MRILFLFFSVLLVSCANKPAMTEPPLTSANRIVENKMSYHLTAGENPALTNAYQHYQQTGIAKTIETEQFIQFPYNVGSQPLVAASVLELTVISLEPGEQVNSVSSGDPLRWSYSLVYSGSGDSRQAHIMIKPTKPAISTDFFITTDRRPYLLKLVASTNGKYVRDVRFWYPEKIPNDDNIAIAELPNLNVSQLNFNYKLNIHGTAPVWAPQQVFDDGTHTYIQLSRNAAAADLPALFIQNGGAEEMVNYRVKMPYFIVDKIFSTAVLISGVGRHQQRVTLTKGV